MNVLIAGRRLLTHSSGTDFGCNRFLHLTLNRLKTCLQNNPKSNSFLWPKTNQIFLKRDINFGKLRTYWRIIRLKDRGINHNFKKDRIDKNLNVLVYKAEFNRLAALFGIIGPLFCVFFGLYMEFGRDLIGSKEILPPDPYENPSFLKRHFWEIMVLVSIFHIYLSKRYVLRMYYNKETNMFTMSIWRWYLPFTTTSFKCKPGSIVLSKWSENEFISTLVGNCRINYRRLYINEDNFIYPVYQNVLFGFSDVSVLKDLNKQSVDHQNLVAERVTKDKNKDLTTNW